MTDVEARELRASKIEDEAKVHLRNSSGHQKGCRGKVESVQRIGANTMRLVLLLGRFLLRRLGNSLGSICDRYSGFQRGAT